MFGKSEKRSPRIAYNVDAFAIGGIETHAMDLAREVVEHGFRVQIVLPVDPPEARAAASERLLQDAYRRQRMSTSGREKVENLFSVGTMTDKTVALYRSFLNGHSGSE